MEKYYTILITTKCESDADNLIALNSTIVEAGICAGEEKPTIHAVSSDGMPEMLGGESDDKFESIADSSRVDTAKVARARQVQCQHPVSETLQ